MTWVLARARSDSDICDFPYCPLWLLGYLDGDLHDNGDCGVLETRGQSPSPIWATSELSSVVVVVTMRCVLLSSSLLLFGLFILHIRLFMLLLLPYGRHIVELRWLSCTMATVNAHVPRTRYTHSTLVVRKIQLYRRKFANFFILKCHHQAITSGGK